MPSKNNFILFESPASAGKTLFAGLSVQMYNLLIVKLLVQYLSTFIFTRALSCELRPAIKEWFLLLSLRCC